MKAISKYAKGTGWTVVATAGLAFICTIAQGWAEQFTIAVVPDTQLYTISDGNMAGFTAQMNYIATHRVSRNIVFAAHLGDMVNGNGGALDQWGRARSAMNILRDSDIPFGIAMGNHDYNFGPWTASGTTVWAGYFGPGSAYFQGRPWHHVNPGNVPDSYQIFYGADRAFLHLVLELETSTASLQWAQQIIQAHPGLPTIVSLHEYLKCNGDRSGNDFRGGSTGLQIWQNLVSTNSQIFMVLCGHTYDLNNGVGQARRMSTNSAGKVVFELLSDYQGAGDTGSGFMRFMEFDSALQCINVTTYSPLLDTQVTDSSSQFTLSFDWNDRFGPAPAGLPPLVITQPMNQTVSSGSEATFRVFAAGSAPLAYQWSCNGTNLAGATDSTYTTSSVQLADSGSLFSCLVSNAYGTMLSSNAVLTVVIPPTQPPVIMTEPADQTVPVGGAATFSVAASGSLPLSYAWMRNGVPIAGASSSSYTTNPVPAAASGSLFSCLVTNAFGSVTSQVATLTVVDPAIISQPVSQERNLGESVSFNVTAAGTPPLSYQWWKGGAALAQATGASLTLASLQASDADSYWVVVSNQYRTVTSAVAVLAVNLATADTFDPGANGVVYCLAEQADGKILVGGTFTTLGGQTRNRIGRLNRDGTLDTTFNPGAAGSDYTAVYALAVQADGKIVVGGIFTTLGGQPRYSIGRLNSNGTVDTSLNSGVSFGVVSLALQADGKILVGGYFSTLGGQARDCIGRLNSNGTVDTTFNPRANDIVQSLAVQADGKILVGGIFTTLGGQARNHIGRLNSNGTLDTTFNPGANNTVYSLAVQADGKILVGGKFTTLGGQPRNYLGRLNADGSADTTFNPGADGYVWSLAVQADGKILVDGYFTTLGGQERNHIGRLNADGTLDTNFNPGTEWGASSLALQADGKILVGGWLGTLGGQPRSDIGRLNNTEPATQSLSRDGATLTWLRGGTSPEVWRTALDVSANGTDWLSLGAGTRISGGWQWTNVSVSVGNILRARGFVSGGAGNASSWFVETNLLAGTPFIAWLQHYGLPTDGSADYLDPDADGRNNWQEWRCQTDPTNALSVLRLLSASSDGTTVTVTWQSVAELNYFLERSTNLSASPPFTLLAPNLPGQPGTTTFTDTNAERLAPLFYRVGVAN